MGRLPPAPLRLSSLPSIRTPEWRRLAPRIKAGFHLVTWELAGSCGAQRARLLERSICIYQTTWLS